MNWMAGWLADGLLPGSFEGPPLHSFLRVVGSETFGKQQLNVHALQDGRL